MPSIARRMQRRCGFGEVVANDARVADLLVTERQLVVRKTDGAGLVRELRMLQGSRMQGNGPRLLAFGVGDAAVQAPQRRELRVGDTLLERVGRTAQGSRRLGQIVLKEPGFSQGSPNRQLVFPVQRPGPEQRDQMGRRLRATPFLQRSVGAGESGMQGRRRHRAAVYKVYKALEL